MNTWKLILIFLLGYAKAFASHGKDIPSSLIPEIENIFLNESFIKSITPDKLFQEINGEFVEVSKVYLEVPSVDINNPYGIVDKMSDLTSTFLAEETTNLNKARAALLIVRESANYVSTLDGSTIKSFPVGLRKTFDDTEIYIAINAIRVYPTHSALEVFIELNRPDWVTPLIFYSPEVTFTLAGGLSGISSVGLLGQMVLPMEDEKAVMVLNRGIYNPDKRTFEGGTYINFDCNGFQALGIDGALHLSREWAVPVLPNGNLHPSERVIAQFNTEISNPNDMVFNVSIDEFVMPSVDRVAWTITDAVLDFSESEKRFDFPVGQFAYNPTISGDGFLPNNEAWKGIYIEEFGIRWVDSLAVNTQTSTMGLSGYEIVVDHNGFTGAVEITGLLPIDEGQIDGWDFSIDRLSVGFLSSEPQSFEFNGELIVPLLAKDDSDPNSNNPDRLSYLGNFDFFNRKYAIGVGITEDKQFDVKMLKAKAVISAGSNLVLENREDEGFGIVATLHGQFGIDNVKIGDKNLNLPQIAFENVSVSSQKDYIRSVGTWGLPTTGGSFLGFGYNAEQLALTGQGDKAEFGVIANLNFTEGQDNDPNGGGIYISASGAFRIEGEIKTEGQKQKYNYKTIKVDMIEIEADLTSVYFYGQFIFFKDIPIWGTGFQGKVELYIAGANKNNEGGEQQPNMGIAAMALFGTDNSDPDNKFRYFLIDALARLGEGITIPSTGLKLKGIGGGVYYHMNQLSVTQDIQDVAFDPGDPESEPDAYTAWIMSQIGVSLSGTQYLPDKSKLFGVNATVVISVEKEEAFNANITFTIQVNSNFGIDFIRMKGTTNFMAPISWAAPSCSGISAAVEMNFIFNNSSGIEPGFYANAFVFANISVNNKPILFGNNPLDDAPPAIISQMKKVCPPNIIKYAGTLELELTKNSWFLNLGRPDSRLNLKADYVVASVNLATYLDIGTNIPPFPGLPPQVEEVTGPVSMEEVGRSTGLGFAFGASYNINFGVDLAIIKGELDVIAGFDIMAKKYDEVNCVNNNNEPLGINQWYSMGQAYAAVHANLSAFSFDIFNAAFAAIMQFEGPNTFFGKGSFTGSYKLPWKSNKSYYYIDFKFGEKCDADGDMNTDQNEEYALINDINPFDNSKNIPVEKEIVTSFNFPLDELTSVINEDGIETNYLLVISDFSLTDELGNIVEAEIEENSYFATLKPLEFLKSKRDYSIHVQVYFVNQTTGNIDFQEELTHHFKTTFQPDEILESNILYSYPGNGQYNLYQGIPNMTSKIVLDQGQDYLFTSTNNYYVKISSSYPAYAAYQPTNYNESSNTLVYSLPTDLIPGQAYKAQLIKISSSSDSQEMDEFLDFPDNNNDNNNNNNPQNPDNLNDLNDGNLSNPSDVSNFLEGDELPELADGEIEIFNFYFRKSLSETPEEKYNNLTFSNLNGRFSDIELSEPFGVEEILGLENMEKTLAVKADFDNTPWFDNYKSYPINNGVIHPYKANSNRSDFTIAIRDIMHPNRVSLYGNKHPFAAIKLVEQNTYLYNVSANNLNQINQANQEGTIYQPTSAKVKYFTDSIVNYDIKYFMESAINGINWQEIISSIDLENYDCTTINACCSSDPEVKTNLTTAFQNAIDNSNDIFKNAYYIDPTKCNHLIPENFEDQGAMLTHDLEIYPLSAGPYSIYFRYQYGEDNDVQYSDFITLSKLDD